MLQETKDALLAKYDNKATGLDMPYQEAAADIRSILQDIDKSTFPKHDEYLAKYDARKTQETIAAFIVTDDVCHLLKLVTVSVPPTASVPEVKKDDVEFRSAELRESDLAEPVDAEPASSPLNPGVPESAAPPIQGIGEATGVV